MKIPTIGQSKGIFEIFVPGAFLLLNMVGVLCLFLHVKIADILCPKGGTNVNIIGLSLVVLICFGYLIGMILRLLMADIPDNLSAWYHHNFNKKESRKAPLTSNVLKELEKDEKLRPVLKKLEEMKGKKYGSKGKFERVLRKKLRKLKNDKEVSNKLKELKKLILTYIKYEYEPWAEEKFPYIGWIGTKVKEDLPQPVHKFYQQVWKPMNKNDKGNKRFLNFCKTLMNKKDNVVMHEIYAAESTNRYISGMFYSLSISFILILITLISPVGREYAEFLASLLAFYFIAIWGIVFRFRYIRCKETATVFDATYQNKDLFLGEKVDSKNSSD
jgi:hypothetical protein